MSTSGYPPGWEADYDGETERWFYIHKPTGVRQYHFPKAGDEVELAAAMSRIKAANETKLKESNMTESSKNLAAASVSSTRENLNPSPTITRSVSERVTPSSARPIPNTFKQSFQAAQSTDATTFQQLSFKQSSQTALPPLNTQLHGTSSLPYQAASSAHPLRINTNALNQGGNASPVESISAGPCSYLTTKGSETISSDRGAPNFSQGSQRITDSSTPIASDPPLVPPKVLEFGRAPAAGSKYLSQAHSHSSSVPHNNAGDVISSRLGILYLSDSDKEDVITNLQNLASMYPDVTLSQLVDPHMELPRAKLPYRPSLGLAAGNSSQSHVGALQSANARDMSPAPAPAISTDSSLPIAFVAYSREPQPTNRTYTSPAAGPNPNFGAPSPDSSFDYQRIHHSNSNASMTSTAIQTPHDRTDSSSFNTKRQDSVGTQTYSPQTRTELAQTAWGLKQGSASTEGPGMATSIPARPATTAPTQAVQSSPDALGTRSSRQHSLTRKPLSSQSPIINRPYRSLSWQPRDHSPNPQLPSSLVSEVPEEPSTSPLAIAQRGSLLASTSSNVYSEGALRPTASQEPFSVSLTSGRMSTEVPLQQAQEKSEADQKEFDRLNSIIKEQNKQLALLCQQNVQSLQNHQDASVLHQGKQPENLGHQRHARVPVPQSSRSGSFTQSSLQNTHYPPSYPSVPVSPISRPESLVYSNRDEEPQPLSLPEPVFYPVVSKTGDIERITENNSLPIVEFEVNAKPTSDASKHFGNQPNQAAVFQSNITTDNIQQEPAVDDKEVISHQPGDTTNEITAAAAPIGDRSESHRSNQTDSKRGSWSHVRTHSATQQIPGQTAGQIAVAEVVIPPPSSANVQTADFSATQEISNITPQIYHQGSRQVSLQDNMARNEIQSAHIVQVPTQPPTQLNTMRQPHHEVSNVPQSNHQRLPSHQRQISHSKVELQTQQHYIAQANPASQTQLQSAQSYQTPNIMSQSAVHEISLQKALEAQIQQHFEASVSPQSAISPPDPAQAQSLYGVNSDSAVSDMSTPGLVHKEYFDPASVRHSQVTAISQRRISKDLSAPASIAEVVEPAQGHARQSYLPKYATAEGPKDYEEKQAFFPDHAPLKIGAVKNTRLQNEVFTEQKPPELETTADVFTVSTPSEPVINDGPKPVDTAASNEPVQFVAFTRPQDTEAAPKTTIPQETKLIAGNPPASTNSNINQTHTHSSKPSVSSWSEMAKPSYPPQPAFTSGVSGGKQDDAAAAESLYDGDGYGDYDDYNDDEPQFAAPQPHLLQMRRST